MKRKTFLLLAILASGTLSVAAEPPAPAKSGETFAAAKAGALKVLLVGGGSSHDFEKWFHQADSKTLQATDNATAYTANVEETLALLPQADVLVLSTNQREFGLSPFQEALRKHLDAGKGLVILHPGAWYNWPPATGYNATIAGGGARSHDALGPFTVTVGEPTHSVMKDVPGKFEVIDELYLMVLEPEAKTTTLATTSVSKKTGQTHASVWEVPHAKGRIIGIALGHDGRVHEMTAFMALLGNAVRWTGRK